MNLQSGVAAAGPRRLVTTGSFVRVARLEDEWYEDLPNPEAFLRELRLKKAPADLFTFWQRVPDTEPRHNYYYEYDHVAVLRIVSFEQWWNNQLNSTARNLARKSQKRGIQVREASFDDEFVKGMTSIFNEVPYRQGRRFPHFGKDFDTVKEQFSRYLFRETLIGAYIGDELAGFVMLAHADRYAVAGQIISKVAHRDKLPNNALIAKAVEICAGKGIPYLVYSYWDDSSLTEFKRRNGFERLSLPRYYVPLTLKGRLALSCGLHRGLAAALPNRLRNALKIARKRWFMNPQPE